MLKRSLLLIPLLSAASLYGSNYSVSVSADTTKFDYAETDSSGNLLDIEKAGYGHINGFSTSLNPRYNGIYISASYAKGNTDYVGGTNLNPIYGSYRTTTTNEVGNYTFGYKATALLDPRSGWEMPVTIGLGYRRWLRQLHSNAGVTGYDELYDWGYYDAGIGLHYAVSSKISLGVDANYRKAFNAQMYENSNGYTFNLKNVYGYKIAVPFEIAITPTISTFFSYNYEYWNIGASNTIGGYLEPDSETKNETLSLGLKFKF
ncbi:hypothetical protein [Sulfuricurvum sp.]|uniref:hypothetical protein n=1 Tax=Sulfuricurvum sp. TaxID=2025608 RepID=UPI0025DB4AA9|nr:hypothetical protein [Sulfuricurvum sp.]